MTKCFAEDIIRGLTDNKKNQIQKSLLESTISDSLMEYNRKFKDSEIDGQALKKDLTPILKDIISHLIKTNFNL